MAKGDAQKKWEARIADFRASGQRATAWCQAHQVNRRQLYSWMKKMDGVTTPTPKPNASQWLTVQIDHQNNAEMDTSIGVKVGSAYIEVKHGFNPGLLRDVVQALQVLC